MSDIRLVSGLGSHWMAMIFNVSTTHAGGPAAILFLWTLLDVGACDNLGQGHFWAARNLEGSPASFCIETEPSPDWQQEISAAGTRQQVTCCTGSIDVEA